MNTPLPRPPRLLGLPYDASSSFLRGAAEAPALIREALWSPQGNPWAELGEDISAADGLSDHGDLDLTDTAAARVAIEAGVAAVYAAGYRPIALGGDHSVSYPVLRAVAQVHPDVTVLHIDAHADLYDVFEGDRYSHACPFARIMEERLASRLVQVGLRTITPHQRDQMARFAVDVFDMRRWGRGERPSTGGAVYVSIDLDGLDPGFAPGVSHREPGGLSVRDVIGLVHELAGPVAGADVVEYNPRQDVQGMTAGVAAKIVKELAGRMMVDMRSRPRASCAPRRGDARGL
jgi:agmatinase